MTVRAEWNGTVLAESDDTVVVEGNHYFPVSAIRTEYFAPSDTHTVCPWKGTASYYTVRVDGSETRTPRGITPRRRTPRHRSRTGWRSGAAWT